jgi:hypothetical protein
MEEEFSSMGLGNSTSLAESMARAETESQAELGAEVARIAPELERIRSAHDLGWGELDLGGKRLALDTGDFLAGIPGMEMDLAGKAFELGEGERAIGDLDLQRQYEEYQRQQSLYPDIMSMISGTPPPSYGPSTMDAVSKAVATAVAAGGK